MNQPQQHSYHIRSAAKSDVPFITNSWLESYRRQGFACRIPNGIYFFYHHKILEQLLTRGYVLVAVNSEDPTQILGWMCGELVDSAAIFHYIYVKRPFRTFGIGKALVKEFLMAVRAGLGRTEDLKVYTHDTANSKYIVGSHPKRGDWVFNPYMCFMKMPEFWYKQYGVDERAEKAASGTREETSKEDTP